MREEAGRLNRLVNNLLEMTRLEAGAIHPRKEWQPLEEVIGSALARMRGPRRAAGDDEVPADLPLVPMDGVLIEQVLVNLIDNAIKYTPAGSPIEIIGDGAGPEPHDRGADRGPGLPPGDGGARLREVLRVAGSRPGGRPRPRDLPRHRGGSRRPDLGPEPARRRRRVPASPCRSTTRRRRPSPARPEPVVVLVEDEPQIRRFLRATLTGQGYRVFEASTGAEGLLQAPSASPTS